MGDRATLGKFGAGMAAALLLAVAGAQTAAAGTNLIANPGFVSRMAAPLTNCGLEPVSPARTWQPYSKTAGFVPQAVSSPVHASSRSLHVRAPSLSGCSTYGAYQDLPSSALPANTSFTFGVWVYPVQGKQFQGLIYPWDHNTGGPTFGVYEDLAAKAVTILAWGQTKLVTFSIAAKKWHHVTLTVTATTHTATLRIDGKKIGTTPAGSPTPAARATVWIGQPGGLGQSATNFYYDTVTLSR